MRSSTPSAIAMLLFAMIILSGGERVTALDSVTINSNMQGAQSRNLLGSSSSAGNGDVNNSAPNQAPEHRDVNFNESKDGHDQWLRRIPASEWINGGIMICSGVWVLFYTQNRRMLRKVRDWRPRWMRYPAVVDQVGGLLIGPVLLVIGGAIIIRHLI